MTHFLQSKKALNKLKDPPHPQFLNDSFLDPYRGCEFGCLYCYGLKEDALDNGKGPSPFHTGMDTSCAFSLKKELSASREHRSIGIGFATDPYQPCEEQYRLTQRCLEILKDCGSPVQILTKSPLVLRDKEILKEMSDKGLLIVSVSLFTLDKGLSRIFEPRAPSPKERLELIRDLRKENITCGAHLMPIFPYLTDTKTLSEIFSALSKSGALYCVPGILSLSQTPVKSRIFTILKEKFPDCLERYKSLYDSLGRPDLNYCERVMKILAHCSEKHQIPTVLPVKGLKGTESLILRDSL